MNHDNRHSNGGMAKVAADVEDIPPPPQHAEEADNSTLAHRLASVVKEFSPLGLICFGGPTAHIAVLRERFVTKHKRIDEESFLELFGLASALPGPTSTQLVIALATIQAGIAGGVLAFLMWSFPSAVIMTIAGVTSGLFFTSGTNTTTANSPPPDWMAGLGPSATAMVFLAAFQLSKSVVNSRVKMSVFSVLPWLYFIYNKTDDGDVFFFFTSSDSAPCLHASLCCWYWATRESPLKWAPSPSPSS